VSSAYEENAKERREQISAKPEREPSGNNLPDLENHKGNHGTQS
jgi:hypothetical protein